MTPLNLLPQRFVSKPQAEWLLHGEAVSLHREKKKEPTDSRGKEEHNAYLPKPLPFG